MKKYSYSIIVVILILSGLFYWFEWRPRSIKKDCSFVAKEQANAILINKYEIIIKKNDYQKKDTEQLLQHAKQNTSFLKDDYEYYYKVCLVENGY